MGAVTIVSLGGTTGGELSESTSIGESGGSAEEWLSSRSWVYWVALGRGPFWMLTTMLGGHPLRWDARSFGRQRRLLRAPDVAWPKELVAPDEVLDGKWGCGGPTPLDCNRQTGTNP